MTTSPSTDKENKMLDKVLDNIELELDTVNIWGTQGSADIEFYGLKKQGIY